MSSWKASGSERHNCTNEDIKPEDLTKPCQLFIRELDFIKKLDKRRNQSNMKKVKFVHSALIINSMCSVQEGTYQDQDINELTKLTGAPIEIEIRINSLMVLISLIQNYQVLILRLDTSNHLLYQKIQLLKFDIVHVEYHQFLHLFGCIIELSF